MTEVDYGGGGHRTRLKDQLINLCLGVPPAPVYKGARREAGRPLQGAPGGGVLLLVGVGLPFPSPTRRGKEGVGEGKGKGAPPPFLVLFGLKGRGVWPALAGPLFLPLGPLRPIIPREGSGNPPVFL